MKRQHKTDPLRSRGIPREGNIMKEIATSIKKPELVAKRREQIKKAAIELFLKNGFHGTTMRQICDASGVNRASIYDYFASKDDILIYLYKDVFYYYGEAKKSFMQLNIRTLNDLETYVRGLIEESWDRNRDTIKLLYRETIALDQNTMKQVMKIESDFIKLVAENLRKGLGLPTVTRELEIMANAITFIDAFVPLRGWNMHHMKEQEIFDFAVDMIMRKLKALKKKADNKS